MCLSIRFVRRLPWHGQLSWQSFLRADGDSSAPSPEAAGVSSLSWKHGLWPWHGWNWSESLGNLGKERENCGFYLKICSFDLFQIKATDEMLLSALTTQQEKLFLLSKGITAPPQIKFHHTVPGSYDKEKVWVMEGNKRICYWIVSPALDFMDLVSPRQFFSGLKS